MATKKDETKPAEKIEELNLDQKVTLKSIADWETGFARIADGSGDVRIMPRGTVRLSRNEIIAQVQNGNALIGGVDGLGSHATLYIDDKPTRIEVGFEDDKKTQLMFTDDLITELFKIKDQDKFVEAFSQSIVTRAEKKAAIRAISEMGLNDYNKIRFIEEYTGYKVN